CHSPETPEIGQTHRRCASVRKGESMNKRSFYVGIVATGALLVASGATAASSRTPPMPPASTFSAHVDNQWFPLRPGTRYVYAGVKEGKPSRDIVTVTHQTRTIDGVPCIAVHDRL